MKHWLRWRFSLIDALDHIQESTAQDADIATVRDVQAQQAAAWNRHDAAAYADNFTNGDVVNVLGWWWKGPTEIQLKLSDAFVYVFREDLPAITGVDVGFSAESALRRARALVDGRRESTAGSASAATLWHPGPGAAKLGVIDGLNRDLAEHQ